MQAYLSAAFVQDYSQGPYIALLVIWLVLAKLWRQVVWCSHDRLGKVGVGAQDLKQGVGQGMSALPRIDGMACLHGGS